MRPMPASQSHAFYAAALDWSPFIAFYRFFKVGLTRRFNEIDSALVMFTIDSFHEARLGDRVADWNERQFGMTGGQGAKRLLIDNLYLRRTIRKHGSIKFSIKRVEFGLAKGFYCNRALRTGVTCSRGCKAKEDGSNLWQCCRHGQVLCRTGSFCSRDRCNEGRIPPSLWFGSHAADPGLP